MAEKRGRGRPRGVKNKKPSKGRTAPAASGTVSTKHNNKKAADEASNVIPIRPDLTDEQSRAIFFQERGKVQDALRRKTDADTNYKNVCKAAKGEGVDLELIKLSLQEPDVLEARAREKALQLQTVCRWMNLPLGTQLSLLDDPVREHSDDRAYNAGELAGLEGKDEVPPYAQHLPQANHWRQGYRAGQEQLRSQFKLRDEAKEEAFDGDDHREVGHVEHPTERPREGLIGV